MSGQGEFEAERAEILRRFGAAEADLEPLLRYGRSGFDLGLLPPQIVLPLAPERFAAVWAEYAEAAKTRGVFPVLKERLVQLRFPIKAGTREQEYYRDVTLRGRSPDEVAEATGLVLERPELLELVMWPFLGGEIALLLCPHRPDYVSLVRALVGRSEPIEISASQGASALTGLNNWDRIARHRRAFELGGAAAEAWSDEFKRMQSDPGLFQDRLILLTRQPYSDVPADALGLPADEWSERSLVIRREHELMHILTERLLGKMSNNLLDEIIADYAGLTAAFGEYRADPFLRFLGLERHPEVRPSGRLQLYRGRPPLSEPAFAVLGGLAVSAARNLERFARTVGAHDALTRAKVALAVAELKVERLAAEGGAERLAQVFAEYDRRVGLDAEALRTS